MGLSRRSVLLATSAGIAGGALGAAPAGASDGVRSQVWETVIGAGTFNGYSALESGSDHNLHMEGSSGSPGLTSDAYYRGRNIYVGRTNNG